MFKSAQMTKPKWSQHCRPQPLLLVSSTPARLIADSPCNRTMSGSSEGVLYQQLRGARAVTPTAQPVDGFGGIVGAARLVACSSSDSVVPEREAPNYDRTMKSADLSTAVSITCARSRLNIGLSHTVRIRWAGARRCRRYTEDTVESA